MVAQRTPRRGSVRFGAVALAAPAMLLLAACGVSETPAKEAKPAPSSRASTLPACSSIWVADSLLPETYQGCQEAGVAVTDSTIPCSMGDVLIQHGDEFYASPGHPIRRAVGGFASDDGYQSVYETCTG
jgi:hypothetical protein